MRSRPQEGQNFDFPVISLPQREQNIRASYVGIGWSSSQFAWRIARGVAKGRKAGKAGKQVRKS
jgi:hypothetical protein